MNGAIETLFFALQSDTIQTEKQSIIFVNAFYHNKLNCFDKNKIFLQQHFRPYAQNLEKRGFKVYDSCDEVCDGAYNIALVLVPKNMIEARYMVARSVAALCDGGTLICAADNKAGGGRIKKLLQEFGFGESVSYSRNKAKAVRALKSDSNVNYAACENALRGGAMQPVLRGRFVSRPGIFGWDKVDVGSKILAEHLPGDIKGKVADLGCGYGYLSSAVLERNSGVKKLFCIDADKRSLQACEWNLQMHVNAILNKKEALETKYLWLDLVNPENIIGGVDYVVMNPPFHQGKATDIGVGLSFIKYAHAILRKGGGLWMVANNHLAYESELTSRFSGVHKPYEGQGFKVFECLK